MHRRTLVRLAAAAGGMALVANAQTAPSAREQDHRQMLDQLGIESLRPGANPNPDAPNAANMDESRADAFGPLPDPLIANDRSPVTTPEQWWSHRRPEIVELFDREIYGRVPTNVPAVRWSAGESAEGSIDGIPTRTWQLVGRADNESAPEINVAIEATLTLPREVQGPVPVMISLGFRPRPRATSGATSRPALAASRPASTSPAASSPSWQAQVLARGWGYVVLYPTSFQADDGAGLRSGIIGLANRGQARRADDWGTLRAWAWGVSRVIDHLETVPEVDARRVGIEGLSRYGKAAAVAMAYEPRLAVGFIGSSGQGGLKLMRRDFGERVENVASSAEYHWMAGNYLKYAGPLTPRDLPVDAHWLVALCAPRPVFISVGSPSVEGQWIDATGNFLAGVHASPVYALLGQRGLSATTLPAVGVGLVDGEIAFRMHEGGHTTGPNWPAFLDWASRYMIATR